MRPSPVLAPSANRSEHAALTSLFTLFKRCPRDSSLSRSRLAPGDWRGGNGHTQRARAMDTFNGHTHGSSTWLAEGNADCRPGAAASQTSKRAHLGLPTAGALALD